MRKFMLAGLLLLGCVDKAEPDYAKCLQLQIKGDVEAAFLACGAAVGAAPNSTSGQKAAKVLTDIKPAYEKAKAEREASEAKAAEERLAAAAAARVQRAKDLRLRVQRKYYDDSPDSLCTGKGMPPYRWSYEGGTFAEDMEVATADGCQKPFNVQEDTSYCCPKSPNPLGF